MNNVGFYFEQLAPFDSPEGEQIDKFIDGQDSVHISVLVYFEKDTNRYVVPKVFNNFLSMIVERGAIRIQDYIITLHKRHKSLVLTLHTTHDFVSMEDGNGQVYDYG